jgi:hypothetical protein
MLLLLCVLNVSYISGSEVKHAVRPLSESKYVGPDEISSFSIKGFPEICALPFNLYFQSLFIMKETPFLGKQVHALMADGRSQSPLSLRHEMSSSIQTLRS